MLAWMNFFLLATVICLIVLTLYKNYVIFGMLATVLSGTATLYWAQAWEIPRAEFVVENASADAVENIGTWVTTNQTYSMPGVSTYIPALLTIFSLLVTLWVAFKMFKRSG